MNEEPKSYLSIEEVAGLLGVNYQLIYRLVRSGELRAARIGRVYRVAKADLDAYLEAAKSAAAETGESCGVCGTVYRSRTSFPGRCEACGVPICTDCWMRRQARRCREHATEEV